MKDNESFRVFALKVQQMIANSLCNDSATIINLKLKELFTKVQPKF